jgi:archaellum component FlaC
MNTNFLAIIKRIIDTEGESILADPPRLKGWISDYAKDEPRTERLAFGRCIEYGAYAELKNAPALDRPAVKGRLAQKLHDEEGLDLPLCTGALNLLEAALCGENAPDAASDEWVTVAEQKAEEEKTASPLTTDPAPGPAAVPFSYQGGIVQPAPPSAPPPAPPPPANMVFQDEDAYLAYEEKRGEAEALKEKLAKAKGGLTAAIIIGLTALAISIGIGLQQYNEVESSLYSQYSRYNSLESQYKSLQSEYNTLQENQAANTAAMASLDSLRSQYNSLESRYKGLQAEYDALQKNQAGNATSINSLRSQYNSLESRYKSLQTSYDTLLKNWVISVSSISVGNLSSNGQWINKPGERLSASGIRYLGPVITYNSQVNREVTLYVKVIRPDGSLNTGNSSPSGYSYSTTGTISIGNNRTWNLTGWGNDAGGTYSPGSHRIEVWYSGIRLATTTVTLN